MLVKQSSKVEFKKFMETALRHQTMHIDFQKYMQQMDRLYSREQDCSKPDSNGSYGTNKLERAEKYNEFVAPVVSPMVEAARAYFANMFLAQDPIFQAAGSKQGIDAATQFNLLLKKDSDAEGWRTELSTAILDALKYDLCCTEVTWVTRTSATVDPTGGKLGKQVLRSSNSMKRIDLYNAFWDKNVSPHKVHREGMYAGYVEYASKIAVAKWFEELPEAGRQCSLNECLSAPKWVFRASAPDIKNNMFSARYITDLGQGANGVTTEFSDAWLDANGNTSTQKDTSARFVYGKTDEKNFLGYDKLTMYVRIIPSDFGITQVPGASRVQIWKTVYINSVLAYAEQMTNLHNYFPMVFGSISGGGLDYQNISYAENVGDVQILASKLWTAELKSTDRMIGDRAIYNSKYIDPKHMATKSPTAKIPLRAGVAMDPSFNITQAYYKIPYEDSGLGLRMQQSSQLFALADRIGGQNPTLQGNFVKGNKTDNQFAETIQGTEARLLLMALAFETDYFTPIKEIIKTNVLQYAVDTLIVDRETGAQFQISAQTLRAGNIEFELGDGLAAASAKAMLPALGQALNIAQTNPLVAQQYDVVGMISYFIKLSGFRRIDDFKLTADQIAANAAQQKAQQQPPGFSTEQAAQTNTQ